MSRPSHPARRRLFAKSCAGAVSAVLLTALLACSPATKANQVAQEILETYEAVPEITNLQVSSELVEGSSKREFVVAGLIAENLDADGITDLLVKHPARIEESKISSLLGGDEPLKLRLERRESDGATLTMSYLSDPDPEQIKLEVLRWQAVQTVVATQMDLLLDTEGAASYAINLGSGREGAVADAYGELLNEPSVTGLEQLSNPSAWELIAEVNGVLLRAASSRGLPRQADIDRIRQINSAIFPEDGPVPLDKPTATPSPTTQPFASPGTEPPGPLDTVPGSFRISRVDVDLADRLDVQAQFTATTPGEVSLATVTPQRYGAVLWPILRAHLALLRGVSEDWSYRVAVEPVGNTLDQGRVAIVTQLKGRNPDAFGDPATSWDTDAWRFLNQRTGSAPAR